MAAMAKFKSDFLNTLDERGFIHQCSDFAGLDALAAKVDAERPPGLDYYLDITGYTEREFEEILKAQRKGKAKLLP